MSDDDQTINIDFTKRGDASRIAVAARWVAVLPVALLAAFIAWFISIHTWADSEMFFTRAATIIARNIIGGASMAGFFVLAGAATAPTHNKTVSIVLASAVATLAVASISLDVYTREWTAAAMCLAILAGGIIGARYVHKQF